MAKKRRRVVANPPPGESGRDATTGSRGENAGSDGENAGSRGQSAADDSKRPIVGDVDPMGIASGLIAGLLVYVSYFPSDSVSVEKGDALWVTFLALAIAGIVFAFVSPPAVRKRPLIDGMMDVFPWCIAGWVMLGAFNLSPPGNLRMATSEAWLWVAAAAVFTASRRVFAATHLRRCVLLLMLSCASGLAVHGLHQHYVSLPQNRMEFQLDPERVLQELGIVAPAGSTERMVFENRLNDGGATATFALANSLAAVLIVGLVVSSGALWLAWLARETQTRRFTPMWVMLGALLLCGGCLLATASRSAVVASLVGVAVMVLPVRGVRPVTSLVTIGSLGLLAVVAIASLGKSEWLEQAPASVSFRLQYWRSTMQLAFQNPWFGAGPGNFQSAYERFREDSAHEQIADPHNMLLETLASGGFVASVMLVLLGLAVFGSLRNRHETGDQSEAGSESCKWIWLGAGLSLTLVWVLSFVTGVVPDIEAHLFAVPTAVAIAVFVGPHVRRISASSIDTVASGCLAAVAIHLMASGGWTVPGVAMYVWLLAGILSRFEMRAEDDSPESLLRRRVWPMVAAAVMVLLTASVYLMSIVPLRQSNSALVAANAARQRADWQRIEDCLDEAIRRDPWSAEAKVQKADLLRWSMVSESPNRSTRSEWEKAIDAAKRTAGQIPSVYEGLGQQQIHVYQRHGNSRDLRAAMETFRDAARWSRANEKLHAQLALIQQQLGDRDGARRSARRAEELANAGGIYERILAKQLVAVAQPIGEPARRSLRMDFAEILLQPLLSSPQSDRTSRSSSGPDQ